MNFCFTKPVIEIHFCVGYPEDGLLRFTSHSVLGQLVILDMPILCVLMQNSLSWFFIHVHWITN